jgi:Spy/CpxP family protein refolding chaperone
MEIGNKNKWQVRIAVLLIFALGFAAGALSWNIYQSRGRPLNGRPDRDRFDQLLGSLQLTTEQRTQVDQILGDARARLIELRKQSEPGREEIRRQTDQRMQSVLTPQQWEQFRQMREEMRSRRRGRGDWDRGQ